MPNDILCRIEECQYNDRHGRCHAEKIEVRSSIESKICATTENTCCETFKPKGLS